MRRRIFSGIQPTGEIHMGNYLGAIREWVRLSRGGGSGDELIFSIVDLHSLTSQPSARALRASTRDLAVALLACGLDPSRCLLFPQSAVRAHCEFTWLFSTLLPLRHLNAMTQYKEKRASRGALLGLYAYPVLMAADILGYRATHVPVGEDQLQHLELAREIADLANQRLESGAENGAENGTENRTPFPRPEALLSSHTRVMSLRDGTQKMSKSDPSALSRLSLRDPPDLIRDKLRRAKTDAESSFLTYEPERRPEVANLLRMYGALTNVAAAQAARELRDVVQLKERLTEAAIETLTPVQAEMARLEREMGFVEEVLARGARGAHELSLPVLLDFRQNLGLSKIFVY